MGPTQDTVKILSNLKLYVHSHAQQYCCYILSTSPCVFVPAGDPDHRPECQHFPVAAADPAVSPLVVYSVPVDGYDNLVSQGHKRWPPDNIINMYM